MVYVGLRAPPLPHCNFASHVLLSTGAKQRDSHDAMREYSKTTSTLSITKRVGKRDFVLSAMPPVLLDSQARMTRALIAQGFIAPGSGYDPRTLDQRLRPREPSRFLTKHGFEYASRTRYAVPNQPLGAACVDRIHTAPRPTQLNPSRHQSPPKKVTVMEQYRGSVPGESFVLDGWDDNRSSDVSSA